MNPVEFVTGIPQKARPDIDDKEQVVQALRAFYCKFLCEDPIDGSKFDLLVLDKLKEITDGL